jgi:hypothetical protein
VDQDELAIVVMEEYDLDLQEWCFWPQGWESYGFIASDGHQRVFVKLLEGYPRTSQGCGSASKLIVSKYITGDTMRNLMTSQ